MRHCCAVMLTGLLLFAVTASAQEQQVEKKLSYGAAGAVVLPMSNWSDIASFGVGALGKVRYALKDKLAVTGRVGIIFHLSSNDFSTREIPILGGVEYDLGPGYVAGEAGFTNLNVSYDVSGFSGSESSTELSLAGWAGYRMGKLDFRAGLYFPSLDDLGDMFALMASGGMSF